MKKITFLLLLVMSSVSLQAQNSNFGIKAGFNSTSFRASFEGVSASENSSGFYLGFFGEFEVAEKTIIQPELQYANISEDGESSGLLLLPIMVKYKVAEKFSLLAGPQLDYILDEDADGIKRLGFGLGAGLSIDITDNFILDGRYVFGLSNRLDEEGLGDVNVKINYVQVGLGYRF